MNSANAMPSEPTISEHRQKARHNENFLNAYKAIFPPDWEVTIRFYEILHWLRAYLKHEHNITKISTHGEASQYLRSSNAPDEVKEGYKRLYKKSKVARYYNYTLTNNEIKQAESDYNELKHFLEPQTKGYGPP